MNTEALLRLADKLEGKGPYEEIGPVPKHMFDMGIWMYSPITSDMYEVADQIAERSECGSSACALGWAATDPYFNALGVNVENIGYDTAMEAFDIRKGWAMYLFDPCSYPRNPSVGTVAGRIRDLVDDGGFQ